MKNRSSLKIPKYCTWLYQRQRYQTSSRFQQKSPGFAISEPLNCRRFSWSWTSEKSAGPAFAFCGSSVGWSVGSLSFQHEVDGVTVVRKGDIFNLTSFQFSMFFGGLIVFWWMSWTIRVVVCNEMKKFRQLSCWCRMKDVKNYSYGFLANLQPWRPPIPLGSVNHLSPVWKPAIQLFIENDWKGGWRNNWCCIKSGPLQFLSYRSNSEQTPKYSGPFQPNMCNCRQPTNQSTWNQTRPNPNTNGGK